jgi:hypothetical protein
VSDAQGHTVFEFLHSVFSGLPGYIEFRLIGSGKPPKQFFYSVDEVLTGWSKLEGILQAKNKSERVNVYFGVNPRTEKVGDAEHVAVCRTLWCDLDTKDPAHMRQIGDILHPLHLYPSVIVDSGHGYHLYWFLHDEIPAAEAVGVMREIARVLGGDPKTHDAPRILRLPGTINQKSDPVHCRMVSYKPVRFNASDFIDKLSTAAPIIAAPKIVAKAAEAAETKPQAASPPVADAARSFIEVPADANGSAHLYHFANALAPWWNEGRRHSLALAVSGMLRYDGATRAEAEKIIEFVARACHDNEIDDRLKAVATTYEMPEDRVGARGTLLKDFSREEVKKIADCYRVAFQRIPAVPVKRRRLPDFDLFKSVSPGTILDYYVSYASKLTDSPLQYHTASILTVLAAAMGNKISVKSYHGKRLFPTLYTLLVGASSRYRKTTALSLAKRLADDAKIPAYSGNATMEALYQEMATNPVEFKTEADGTSVPVGWEGRPYGGMYFSEFGAFLDLTRKGYMGDLRMMLTNWYDGLSGKDLNSRKTKTSGRYYIEDPAISILGGVTTASIRSHVQEADISNGFLSRFLIVMPDPTHKNERRSDFGVEDVDSKMLALKRLEEIASYSGELEIASEASKELHAFEDEMLAKMERYEGTDREPLDPFLARLTTMSVKLSMVYAFAHSFPALAIDRRDAEYACNFCRYSARTLEGWYEKIKPDEGNKEVRYKTRVIEMARGLSKTVKDGMMRHQDLLSATGLDSRQFKQAIESLVDEGRLLRRVGGARATYVLNEQEVEAS